MEHKRSKGNSMSCHPAILPTSDDLSEGWWVESTNPIFLDMCKF